MLPPRGTSATGTLVEQQFHLTERDGPTRQVRRLVVTVRQPRRDGDRQIAMLTNLPPQVSAKHVAELYHGRWRIETVMQQLTTTLRCEIKPLCYPQAALFGFALALVMYNAVALVLAALEVAHGTETRQPLSRYGLALEITQATDGLLVVRK